MTEPRFQLDRSSKKFHCPRCGEKRFNRFIDKKTNMLLPEKFGRCDREQNCQYFLHPSQDPELADIMPVPLTIEVEEKETDYINKDILKGSCKMYDRNNFYQFLLSKFGKEKTNYVTALYRLGTSKKWDGANIFWQIDRKDGLIRTGKIMLYNKETGKRVKKPFNHTTWVHKNINKPEYTLKQCFFGEHTINKDRVHLVESEKTAMIAKIVYPEFDWIASGGLMNISAKKINALGVKKIVMIPDCGVMDKWQQKAADFKNYCKKTELVVSSQLENKASENQKEQGWDLADFILNEL